MKITNWLLIFLLGTSTCFGVQDEVPPASKTESKQNDDSIQQEDEADPETRRFREADLDEDGSISFLEMKVYLDDKLPGYQQYRRLMEGLDQNADQGISPDEFLRRRELAKKLENEPLEFTDKLNNRFDAQEPLVGTEIKSLVGFDESGKAVNFKSFRGKYTVITFGCLT